MGVRRLGVRVCLVSSSFCLLACGSSSGDDESGANGAAGSGAGSSTAGTGSIPVLIDDAGTASGGSAAGSNTGAGGGSVAPGQPGGDPVSEVTSVDPVDACATDSATATLSGLDIFILQDSTLSMADATASRSSKWEVITGAIESFVSDPESAGIGAGLAFFGIPNGNGSGRDGVSCDPADYARPVVPIANLNGNGPAIVDSIRAKTPEGYTPSAPALQGALQYAADWAVAHPDHRVIVVMATDGLPTACGSSTDSGRVEDTIAVAEAGLDGTPSIPTYVIGVVGRDDSESVTNLNSFARAGGTGSAFIVDPQGDTQTAFLSAMNAIRAANRVGCDFAIPAPSAGLAVDYTQVTVSYASGSADPDPIAWVASDADCDAQSGGWYYDRNSTPTRMLLCDATCTVVQADPEAQLDIAFACVTPTTPGSGGAAGGGGTSGSGGTSSGGGTSGSGGGPACLLPGQSCQTDAECCSGTCNAGLCGDLLPR